MPNAWISHIKEWAIRNGVSYGCALTKPECKASYHAKKPGAERGAMSAEDVNRALPKKRVVRGRTVQKSEIERGLMGVEDINRAQTGMIGRNAIQPPKKQNPFSQFSEGQEVVYDTGDMYNLGIITNISDKAIYVKLDKPLFERRTERGDEFSYARTFKGKAIILKKNPERLKTKTQENGKYAEFFRRGFISR